MKSPYTNFIAIDVETGGLLSAGKKAVIDVALTEIALVVVNYELTIVEQCSWLIKPYKDDLIYTSRAEEVSGISKAMCEQSGIDIYDAVKQMIDIFKKYREGRSLPVLFGHNFPDFDSHFVLGAFDFCKENLLKYVHGEPEDTMKWSRYCWCESLNYKLGTCCSNAGITLQDAHRALSDTIATAQLWIYFMKRLRGIGAVTSTIPVQRFRDTFEM